MNLTATVEGLPKSSGYATMTWQQLVMLVLSFILIYLATVGQFEPLLLFPIFFGILMSNLPHSGTPEYSYQLDHRYDTGTLGIMYMGVGSSFLPCMMSLAVGAATDFSPLIVNPISLLPGTTTQLDIYCALISANATGLFTPQQAAATDIVSGADGLTAIYIANNLALELVVPIVVAAYSYMALIPLIQPPITNLLTMDKERRVKVKQLRKVSKVEKIIFPIPIVCLVFLLLLDAVLPLCMLMLGNLFRECGVVERLSGVAQNALCNICTIFPGLSVGATACGELFLRPQTLTIVAMGFIAFSFSIFGGVVFSKVLYAVTGGKIDPLTGSAGVSTVLVAARVPQTIDSKTDRTDFLLTYAMGPNVAGVIGSVVATGFFLTFFAH